MCKYCSGEFVGDKPITPISDNSVSGITLLVEGVFLYSYCKCGVNTVAKIKYCPMCGEKLDD